MSLYSAMLAGVAGLQSNSTALAAISQNIANVNTVGYKTNNAAFETLVTSSTGDSTYSAGGVTTNNQQFVSQQGSMTQTSSPTDLAITGQGMFVTNTQPTTVNANSQVLFTRAGSFTTDKAGYLENSAGLYLMGWPADDQGNIATSNSLSSLTPININALSGAVSQTSTASVTGNVDATQTESAAAQAAATGPTTPGAYNATTNSMTAYNASAGAGVAPDFTIQVPVSDSLGGQHILQVDFLKTSTPNTWDVEVQSVPTSDAPGGGTGPQGQIAYGTATFNSTGGLTGLNLTDSTTGTTTNSTGSQALDVNWNPSLGLGGTGTQTVNLDLSGLTQYSSASSVTGVITNGTTFGSLSSVSVGSDGTVTATFDNGTSRAIAKIAMATFPNENGLMAVNGDAYQATTASGAYNLTTAGAGGAGKIASSALEASTVDLSTEFTNLITTQSAYSAASKVITTADNMTQALLAIIQG